MHATVLVVDDDPLILKSLESTIKHQLKYDIVTLDGGQKAIDLLLGEDGRSVNVVLLDLTMPNVTGLDVIREVRAKRPRLPIIIHTANADVQSAVHALQLGATDYIEKSEGPERIKVAIENAMRLSHLQGEVDRLKRSASGEVKFDDIIGESKVMRETKSIAATAAESNIPVLIKGESGVGKEMFARAIHGNSSRAGKPFVAINCGAIPENLVESVLFGHEKGAFTGAVAKSLGKFREADGGTLFLDEIGELRADTQVKLLRALQEGEVEPVGGKTHENVDVRIISATNRRLKDEVSAGRFREDLYYRLNVFPITVPALRERGKDIPALLEHFILKIASHEHKPARTIDEKTEKILSKYAWPGNVRQLENAVYRAVVLSAHEVLNSEDFAHIIRSDATITAQAGDREGIHIILDDDDEVKPMSEIEADVIRAALLHYDWKISKVARMLDIGRSTLYRKMSEYGISQGDKDEA